MAGLVPPWWRVYCEPGAEWDADDLPLVLQELEKKPLNRQLLSPVVASYIAGLLQSSGAIGYLRILESPIVFTPIVVLRCDEDTASFVVRQVGEAWVTGRETRLVIYVLGLRAVILLKLIGPYLRSFKRAAYNAVVKYGYKLGEGGPFKVAREFGLSLRYSVVRFEGKFLRQVLFGRLNKRKEPST